MMKEIEIANDLIAIIKKNILMSGISEREREPGNITDVLIDSIKTKYENGTFYIYFSKDAVRPSVFTSSSETGYLPILWNERVDVTKGYSSKTYGLWRDPTLGDEEGSNRYVYSDYIITNFSNNETRFSHMKYGWMETSLAEMLIRYPDYQITLNKEIDFIS